MKDFFAKTLAVLSAKQPPNQAAIESEMKACEGARVEAEAEIGRLAAERQAALVDGGDLDAIEAALTQAGRGRDRADAVMARLRDKLVEAKAATAVAQRAERKAEVEKAHAEALKALRGYPAARNALLQILKATAQAQVLADEFGRTYPGEAVPPDPELVVRAPPGRLAPMKLAETVKLPPLYDRGADFNLGFGFGEPRLVLAEIAKIEAAEAEDDAEAAAA